VKFRKTKIKPLIIINDFIRLRFFKKRFLEDVKAKYFLLETKMQGLETKCCSERHRDGFAGPRGHSANLEA